MVGLTSHNVYSTVSDHQVFPYIWRSFGIGKRHLTIPNKVTKNCQEVFRVFLLNMCHTQNDSRLDRWLTDSRLFLKHSLFAKEGRYVNWHFSEWLTQTMKSPAQLWISTIIHFWGFFPWCQLPRTSEVLNPTRRFNDSDESKVTPKGFFFHRGNGDLNDAKKSKLLDFASKY